MLNIKTYSVYIDCFKISNIYIYRYIPTSLSLWGPLGRMPHLRVPTAVRCGGALGRIGHTLHTPGRIHHPGGGTRAGGQPHLAGALFPARRPRSPTPPRAGVG